MSHSVNLQDRFTLDETKARAFLGRALRRAAGDLKEGEGEGAALGENWELEPGWDLDRLFRDDLGHVEDLIYHARQCGALTCPAGHDIELLTDATEYGDWSYQWRIGIEGAQFAICSRYREDFWHLGMSSERMPKAKGSRAAWLVLTEAAHVGSLLLGAFSTAAQAS